MESSGRFGSFPSRFAAAISAFRAAKIGASILAPAARSLRTLRQRGSALSASQRKGAGKSLQTASAVKVLTV